MFFIKIDLIIKIFVVLIKIRSTSRISIVLTIKQDRKFCLNNIFLSNFIDLLRLYSF